MSHASTRVGERVGSLRERPERAAVGASRVALLALLVGFLGARAAGLRPSMETQAAVYLFGMVALNLPHGGYEHFENLRRRAPAFGGAYVLAYLALVGAFLAVLFLVPAVGLALMLAVAVAKGGHGGLHAADALVGTDHLRGRAGRTLFALARGGAVMAVPMVAWPDTFYAFGSLMAGIFEPGALAGLDPARTRPLVAAGYGTVVLGYLGLGAVGAFGTGGEGSAGGDGSPNGDGSSAGAGDGTGIRPGRRLDDDAVRSWLVDAAETLLLVAYFAVVPVVVAVGLYFPLWYSLRQVGRALAVDADAEPGVEDPPLVPEDPGRATLVAWAALVVGAATTAGLFVALYVLAPNPLAGSGPLVGGVALWSVFISVVALPHVVVGSWVDRRRGIWYVP